MIQIQEVCKSFRDLQVLKGVSLEVSSGEVTVLTGANGSGKSTLLKMIAGLVRPDSGGIQIGAYNLLRQRVQAQQLFSFLPQNLAFYTNATPRQVLSFYTKLRNIEGARAEELLKQFDLAHAATRSVNKLSGGMLQRLGLALTLLPDAPILILDEPATGLDPEWRERFRESMLEEADRGKTILLTSHQPEEWRGFPHRRVDCREGNLFLSSEREEIKKGEKR